MLDFQFQKEFNNRIIRTGPKETIEMQEIILDQLARKKEKELKLSEKKIEVPLSRGIIKTILLVSIFIVAVLFGKTFQLQVLQGKEFLSQSEDNRLRTIFIKPERGIIYDRNLKPLVFNEPSFDLILDKRDFPQKKEEREEVFKKIAAVANKDYESLKKEINESKFNMVPVLENLDHSTLILLKTRINEFPGFRIEENTIRHYPEGANFAHLIGYTGKIDAQELKNFAGYSPNDYVGKAGLEKSYEEFLKGKPGKFQTQKNVYGKKIGDDAISRPEPGKGIVLWLDEELQNKVASSLEQTLRNSGGKSGAVVALDPKTGGVLAMVSLPSFDNNIFSQNMSSLQWQEISDDPNNPLFNRVFNGTGYPTGSVIKPLVGLAALEEGIITKETQIYSPLEICLQNPWYPEKKDCFADWKYHGASNLERAIAESVNTFFYQIGGGYENVKGLGAEKIKKWIELFGWGSKTGIDLPEEGKGILPDFENDWRIGDTYHFSIGQGPFSATPLQVASAFVAIANGGKIFQPKAVKEIVDTEKNVIQKIEPEVTRENFFQKENLEVVRRGMRQGVTSPDGSSYVLNSLPVKAAAKTGTAQTSKSEIYDNWVTVFAPYDDPKIVLTVVIEDVPGMQAAALPVAKEVLNWYFSR